MNIVWNRIDLKSNGKAAFKENYWSCVLVALVLGLITGISAFFTSDVDAEKMYSLIAEGYNAATAYFMSAGSAFFARYFITLTIGALIVSIFLVNPILAGCRRFYYVNSMTHKAEVSILGYAFNGSRYSKIVLTMFLNDLYIFLWTLLFIFPGLVKSYSYRMVPYIITEHPELEPNEAITISRNMMYGHKWDTWILDLSFIGWNILNYMTFGILGIFYVNPYICATDAQIYKILKEDREQGMNIIDSDGEYI